jgi:hypothetical protein
MNLSIAKDEIQKLSENHHQTDEEKELKRIENEAYLVFLEFAIKNQIRIGLFELEKFYGNLTENQDDFYKMLWLFEDQSNLEVHIEIHPQLEELYIYLNRCFWPEISNLEMDK